MKIIAIISDIHGNLPALDAVFKDISDRGIKTIYCLGDLTGKGPSSAEVVDKIRENFCSNAKSRYWSRYSWIWRYT